MAVSLSEHTTMVDREDIRREHGYHPVPVKHIVQETDDTRSFVLEVAEDLSDLFRYRPGQFCTFRVRVDDEDHLRCYSMSSAPETDDDLTVTVKRVPGGVVSNWFNDHVEEGDVLEVTKPAGVFCPREGNRPVVAFCGGSGVTPVISIAKSVLTSSDRPVRMLYANRDEASVIFHDQLEQLQARHPDQLAVRHHFDTDGGYLERTAVTDFAAGDLDADFYICGPTPFMDLVETALLDAGVDQEQISIERFVNDGQVLPTEAVPGVPEDDVAPDTAGDASASETPDAVTVILKGKRHDIDYQPGDTLLETARRGGLQAPYSCESGNCATCMALLHDGSATMRVNNALTPDEVEEGWVLTCQALPSGSEVTVEYEDL